MEKEFHCTHCGTPTSACDPKAIDMEWKVARCVSCKQLFDISFQLEGIPDQSAPSAGRSSSNHSGAVTVTENEGRFLLVHRWAHPTHIWHMIIGTILTVVATILLLKGGWEVLVPFGSLWCLGALIIYRALAGMLNSTRIEISDGRLKTEHGPLPWPGQRELSCADIKQFFVKEKVFKKGGRTYALHAVLGNDRKIAVLPERMASEDLSFVERALESHLAIVDKVVPDV